jgi:NAD(P)-dependent dehydrogenase (short-subunit alcohol dehydrogenase family)
MSDSTPDLAIVTGAGRGIGRAAALAIGALGVPVLCVSRTASAAAVTAEIKARGGTADALEVDLADYGATRARVAEYLEPRPAKRLAVVAAAGMLGPRGPLWESDLAGWDMAFRVNVLGNIAVLQAALPRMRASGSGRVVMFAGGGSAYAYPTFPAYALSKTALVREVENIGVEMRDLADFSAVILAPGAVDTDMLAEVRASGAEVRTLTAISEPVGFVTAFLASPEARKLSGRFVHVRDVWRETLAEPDRILSDNHWKLRRVE